VRGASFAQVLDRLIAPGECATLGLAEAGRKGTIGPSMTTAPISGAPCVHPQGYVSIPFFNSLPPSRPRRVLSARMRAALDVLRSAGAVDLPDDFLLAELKAAFRRLARSAHPDMHPCAGEHEQRCLVARFREIREAYQVLTAI
jgi:DnaJ domain